MLLQPHAGRRLRVLRERAQLTRAQLSTLTGVPVSSIARLERGADVRLSTYLPISNYFVEFDPRAWMLAQVFVGLPAERRAELLSLIAGDGGAHD